MNTEFYKKVCNCLLRKLSNDYSIKIIPKKRSVKFTLYFEKDGKKYKIHVNNFSKKTIKKIFKFEVKKIKN